MALFWFQQNQNKKEDFNVEDSLQCLTEVVAFNNNDHRKPSFIISFHFKLIESELYVQYCFSASLVLFSFHNSLLKA